MGTPRTFKRISRIKEVYSGVCSFYEWECPRCLEWVDAMAAWLHTCSPERICPNPRCRHRAHPPENRQTADGVKYTAYSCQHKYCPCTGEFPAEPNCGTMAP
jgi:hypothetical protein